MFRASRSWWHEGLRITDDGESPFAVSDRTLIYAMSPTGAATGPTLTWLDRSGKTISVVANNASDLKLSPDAQRVA